MTITALYARRWIAAALLATLAVQPLVAFGRQKKLPVPDADAQAASMKIVKEIYGADYKKADSLPAKQELAKKPFDSGKKTQGDLPGKFVLLKLARDVATQGLDGLTAFQAVDAISDVFEIDPIVMKTSVLKQGAAHAKTIEQHKRLMQVALSLVDAALVEDNYAVAKELCDFASSQASAANDTLAGTSATKRGKEVEEVLAVLYDKAETATAMLHENPTNPSANTAYGKYLCFVKGDWDNGILMLALGDDPKLKSLANNELVELTSRKPEDLGDDWWDHAEKESGAFKSRAQERASYWYREALPKLSGLAKARVEKRLESVAGQQPPSPATVAGKPAPKEAALPEHNDWTVPYTWTEQVQKFQQINEFNPTTHQMNQYKKPYMATVHKKGTKVVKAKLVNYDYKAGNVVLKIHDKEKNEDIVRSFKYAALGPEDKTYLDSIRERLKQQ